MDAVNELIDAGQVAVLRVLSHVHDALTKSLILSVSFTEIPLTVLKPAFLT